MQSALGKPAEAGRDGNDDVARGSPVGRARAAAERPVFEIVVGGPDVIDARGALGHGDPYRALLGRVRRVVRVPWAVEPIRPRVPGGHVVGDAASCAFASARTVSRGLIAGSLRGQSGPPSISSRPVQAQGPKRGMGCPGRPLKSVRSPRPRRPCAPPRRRTPEPRGRGALAVASGPRSLDAAHVVLVGNRRDDPAEAAHPLDLGGRLHDVVAELLPVARLVPVVAEVAKPGVAHGHGRLDSEYMSSVSALPTSPM